MLLNIETAAQMLMISENTLLKLAATGEIPAIKLANKWRFVADQLESWVAEQAMKEMTRRRSVMQPMAQQPQQGRRGRKRNLYT